MKKFLFLVVLLGFIAASKGQGYSGSGNYNRIGFNGKYVLFNFNSSELTMGEAQSGFLGGLSTRGRLKNNFGVVYGMDFFSSGVTVKGRPLGSTIQEDVDYSLIGAQLNLLLSYNILGQHLAIDFGPSLFINGELDLRDNGQEDNILQGYTSLRAEDISDISKVNLLGTVAITGGFESVRFTLQYQFAVTNMLNKLNNSNLQGVDLGVTNDFKAEVGIISGGIILYL